MHVSSTLRIKPRIDLARRPGFQAVRTRVPTPIENQNAIQTLEMDRQLQAELDHDGLCLFRSRPPPR